MRNPPFLLRFAPRTLRSVNCPDYDKGRVTTEMGGYGHIAEKCLKMPPVSARCTRQAHSMPRRQAHYVSMSACVSLVGGAGTD